MDIIFNRQVAEELSEKYLVLELEPHSVGEDILETFCVIQPEKVVNEVTMLDHWKKLHSEFVQANKDKNGRLCEDLAVYLKGKWGGELDEFYDIVCSRFSKDNNTI